MLDGTGNARRDVKLWGDDLAGLAHLPVIRRIAGIDGSARCTNGSTQLVSNRKDDFLEFFRRTESTATRDDDLRRGQFRTVGRGQCIRNERGDTGVFSGGDRLDRCRTAFCRCRKGRRANGDDLLAIGCLNGLNGITGIDRALEGVRADNFDDFRDLSHVEKRSNTRRDVLCRGGRRSDDDVIGRGKRNDQRRQRFRQLVCIGCIVGKQHLGNAGEFCCGVGSAPGAGSGDQHMDVAANLSCRRQGLCRQVGKGCVVVFCQKKNGHENISLFRNLRGRRRL